MARSSPGTGPSIRKTITGESLPVPRGPGEAVYAATGLREGYLTIRATRVGNETTAAQIVQLVESAPVGETRMQNHAERFADRLVGPTLTLAAGMGIGFADINRFTSLVIVDYGTGIRVAAPTSVLASMTHAARQGIIIKSGAHLEKLAEVDTIVFDKTGTLTAGIPHVHDVISYKQRTSRCARFSVSPPPPKRACSIRWPKRSARAPKRMRSKFPIATR
jgi:P-type E1-E2 ATPase